MKEVYCYKGISGRYRFVNLKSYKGMNWTDEPMPVKVNSIDDIFPADNLIDKAVELNSHKGKITGYQMNQDFHTKKYLGDGKYLYENFQFNHLISVYWYSGFNSTWVQLYKCKIL